MANAAKFANADRIPLKPIPWLFIVPGVLLALFAGAALVLDRQAQAGAAAMPAGVATAR